MFRRAHLCELVCKDKELWDISGRFILGKGAIGLVLEALILLIQ